MPEQSENDVAGFLRLATNWLQRSTHRARVTHAYVVETFIMQDHLGVPRWSASIQRVNRQGCTGH